MPPELVSLAEAARLTGLEKLEIVRRVHSREIKMRKGSDGRNGVIVETLRGVNGYAPPEPPPEARPQKQPPPDDPPLWHPSPGEIAAIVRLDDRGRAMAIAALVRQHPHLQGYFRDNPLPPVFRRRPPPPPPEPPRPTPSKPKPLPPEPPPQPRGRLSEPTRARGGLLLLGVLIVGYGLYIFAPVLVQTFAIGPSQRSVAVAYPPYHHRVPPVPLPRRMQGSGSHAGGTRPAPGPPIVPYTGDRPPLRLPPG